MRRQQELSEQPRLRQLNFFDEDKKMILRSDDGAGNSMADLLCQNDIENAVGMDRMKDVVKQDMTQKEKPSQRRIKDLLCSPIGINDDDPFDANEEEKQLLEEDDELLVGSNESDLFLLHEKTPPLLEFDTDSDKAAGNLVMGAGEQEVKRDGAVDPSWDDYLIEATLGEGSYGKIYKVREKFGERRLLAIK